MHSMHAHFKSSTVGDDLGLNDPARILIAEDEVRLGLHLAEEIESEGIPVAGPAPTTVEAFSIIKHQRRFEGAVLDVNLADGLVFPVADKLTSLNVPFVFFTASDDVEWPERFRATPKFQKPVSWRDIKASLFKPLPQVLERAHDRSFRRELDVALPQLRVLARQLTGNPHAADDLVEATLKQAIDQIRSHARPRDISVHHWLSEVMIDISMKGPTSIN